ncbi:hypothetical protein ABZS66_10110 [Dactylosporangium sp. NPDC005572]|uniref:hypothetical protein n=1 Tax=Dactylosporangium sp. NPDC005572 TaxID=3156889 RepID=UPI00339FC71E
MRTHRIAWGIAGAAVVVQYVLLSVYLTRAADAPSFFDLYDTIVAWRAPLQVAGYAVWFTVVAAAGFTVVRVVRAGGPRSRSLLVLWSAGFATTVAIGVRHGIVAPSGGAGMTMLPGGAAPGTEQALQMARGVVPPQVPVQGVAALLLMGFVVAMGIAIVPSKQ